MKIPDELKGKEVKKFEQIDFEPIYGKALERESRYYVSQAKAEVFDWILNNRPFFNQDFTPDMIEEYFEVELLVEDSSMTDSFWLTIGKETDKHLTDYKALTFKPRPKTLSDFIDACLNSGIKLKWRE